MAVIRSILAALVVSGAAQAQDIDPEEGRKTFATYCWQCHGKDASGTGPMAEMLAIAPPDLTQLSARNGGAFPTDRVAMQIDGRSPLLAHGGDMPLFGTFFESDANVALKLENGQPLLMGVPLANVIAYLESLQAK